MNETEIRIRSLRAALDEAKRGLQTAQHRNRRTEPIWRYGHETEDNNLVELFKKEIHSLQRDIIDLERSLVDPIEYAERKAEIQTAIAMNGNWDDRAEWYLHTPMEEELWQEQIDKSLAMEDQYSMDYWYDEAECDSCLRCDSLEEVMGKFICDTCFDEALAFAYFVNLYMDHSVYEFIKTRDQFWYNRKDTDADYYDS